MYSGCADGREEVSMIREHIKDREVLRMVKDTREGHKKEEWQS
jgi:hypothetical protein